MPSWIAQRSYHREAAINLPHAYSGNVFKHSSHHFFQHINSFLGMTMKHLPKRSMTMELPSNKENPMSTQGRKGAWKLSRPKKFIRTYGFRRLQIYTSMIVNAWPRKNKLAKTPKSWGPSSQGWNAQRMQRNGPIFRATTIPGPHNAVS